MTRTTRWWPPPYVPKVSTERPCRSGHTATDLFCVDCLYPDPVDRSIIRGRLRTRLRSLIPVVIGLVSPAEADALVNAIVPPARRGNSRPCPHGAAAIKECPICFKAKQREIGAQRYQRKKRRKQLGYCTGSGET